MDDSMLKSRSTITHASQGMWGTVIELVTEVYTEYTYIHTYYGLQTHTMSCNMT